MLYFVIIASFAQESQLMIEHFEEIGKITTKMSITLIQSEASEDTDLKECLDEQYGAILDLVDAMETVEDKYQNSIQSLREEEAYKNMMDIILNQAFEIESSFELCGSKEAEAMHNSISEGNTFKLKQPTFEHINYKGSNKPIAIGCGVSPF